MMSRLRERLTAERHPAGGVPVTGEVRTSGDAALPPPVGGMAAWLRARPALREKTMIWLLRGAMLAYMLAFVTVLEAALLALQRLF